MEKLKTYFKKSLPYLLATISFVVLSYIYFSPLLVGKDLSQMDQNHAKGMAKEIEKKIDSIKNKITALEARHAAILRTLERTIRYFENMGELPKK